MTPASHTLNANTGAIGVSICSMSGSVESPFSGGCYPLNEIQWNAMSAVVATLAKRYNIPVTRETVLTHAEVQPTLGIRQRNKWDINRLPFNQSLVGHYPVGDEMRRRVAVELDALRPQVDLGLLDASRLPRYRVKGVAPSTLNLRASPGGDKIGELSEGTLVERIAIDQSWWRIRTRTQGYVGWVSSSFLVAA